MAGFTFLKKPPDAAFQTEKPDFSFFTPASDYKPRPETGIEAQTPASFTPYTTRVNEPPPPPPSVAHRAFSFLGNVAHEARELLLPFGGHIPFTPAAEQAAREQRAAGSALLSGFGAPGYPGVVNTEEAAKAHPTAHFAGEAFSFAAPERALAPLFARGAEKVAPTLARKIGREAVRQAAVGTAGAAAQHTGPVISGQETPKQAAVAAGETAAGGALLGAAGEAAGPALRAAGRKVATALRAEAPEAAPALTGSLVKHEGEPRRFSFVSPGGQAALERAAKRPLRPQFSFMRNAGAAPHAEVPRAAMAARAEPRSSGKPAGIKDIIKTLENAGGAPVRFGRFRSRTRRGTLLGYYRPDFESVRVDRAQNLPTVAHEVFHHLDKRLGLQRIATKNDLEAPLLRINPEHLKGYKPQQWLEESIAEFGKLYITDPEAAKAAAPRFYSLFEQAAKSADPSLLDALHQAQNDYQAWLSLPAAQRIMTNVSVGQRRAPAPQPLKERLQAGVDRFAPLRRYEEALAGKAPLTAARSPYKLARLSQGAAGAASSWLHDAALSPFTKARMGPALDEILKPVRGKLDDFRAYLIARRAVELHNRGMVSGFRREDAQEALALAKANPEFKRAAAQIYGYQDNLLRLQVRAGLLSTKAYEKIKESNLARVPFYRIFDDAQKGLGGATRGFAGQQSTVRRIKGSEREVIDPLESIIRDTFDTLQAVSKQRVANALVKLAHDAAADGAHGVGAWVEPIKDQLLKPITVRRDEAAKALVPKFKEIADALGFDVDDVPDDLIAKMAESFTIFRQAEAPGRENIITVLRNGKPKHYQVDPVLYRAMTAMDEPTRNVLVNLLSYPSRLVRTTATVLSPAFAAKNVLRDQFSATVQSQYGYVPFVDFARGLYHAAKKDDLYWDWMRSGGAHAAIVSVDRNYAQNELRAVLADGERSKALNIIRHPIDLVRAFNEYLEQATRLGEFQKAVKKTGRSANALLDAAMASREVSLDFARSGATMQQVNQVVPFFNAAVQGGEKLARTFIERPKEATVKALAAITVPTVALYLLNRRNPAYRDLPQYEKDMYWVVPAGGVLWRIPKPFEAGALFGAVPERIMQSVLGKDPHAFDGLTAQLWQSGTPGWLPSAFLPWIEVLTNHDFFYGGAISPERDENVFSFLDYAPTTPLYARLLGAAARPLNGGAGVSPRNIQHVVEGYTGNVGRLGERALDFGLRKSGLVNEPEPAAPFAADLPFVGQFIAQPSSRGGSSGAEDIFYRQHERLTKMVTSARRMGNAPDPAVLAAYHEANKVAQRLGKLRSQARAVQAGTVLSPAGKRKRLQELYAEMARLSQDTVPDLDRALGK